MLIDPLREALDPNKLLLPKPALQIIKADSAITKHLKENLRCISEQLKSNFTVLSQARTKAHLDVLEAWYIRSQLPDLCCQKDFFRVLSLLMLQHLVPADGMLVWFRKCDFACVFHLHGHEIYMTVFV